MIQNVAFIGLCLVGVWGIFQFIGNLLNRDKKELDKAINGLLVGFPPIDKDKKHVRVNALLYKKILHLYNETCHAVKKGKVHDLQSVHREVRTFCLEHARYLSKEVGESSIEFINSLNEHLISKFPAELKGKKEHLPHHQLFLQKSFKNVQKLKILIQEELTQTKIH